MLDEQNSLGICDKKRHKIKASLRKANTKWSQSLKNMEWKRQESYVSYIAKCVQWYDWSQTRIEYVEGCLGNTREALYAQYKAKEILAQDQVK